MNRPLIITIGVAIILIILVIWLYLFMFGTPEDTGDVFANLGFSPTSQPTTITPPEDSPTIDTLVDTTTGSLRQLTTRSVAGFMSTTTSAGEVIRYAERGTGHVFEIDLDTGVESIISRSTIPQVAEAVFSQNATHVAFTAYSGYTPTVFVGRLENDEVKGINLEPGAQNIAFTLSNDVLYSVVRNGVTTGYRHNLTTETRVEQFTFNFTNLTIGWGNGLPATYLITKPAATLEGFIYRISGTAIEPTIPSGTGLTGFFGNSAIVATYRTANGYRSAVFKTSDDSETPLAVLALPEKCSFDSVNENFIWCAAPASTPSAGVVDSWYKGVAQSSDLLWLLNIPEENAELLAIPENLIGRSLDVTGMSSNVYGTNLFFKNKTDQTLWLFDLTAD